MYNFKEPTNRSHPIDCPDMTDSTENPTPSKSTKFKNSNSLVQIQIKPKSQFELAPRNTEEPEYLDLANFWDIVLSVETVIRLKSYKSAVPALF